MHTSTRTSHLAAVLPALALCAVTWTLGAAEIQGILPAGVDGRALNLDFESGDLRDWTASGEAFKAQPLQGDVVSARRKDMKSGHQGQYWVNSFEHGGDPLQGTLTSAPFKVTQPWAAFLVAGGPYENTRVELVRKADNAVIFKTSGFDGATFKKSNNASEELRPVVADLREQQGQEIFIRVVDKQEGHWAHINFDDFRLYAEKPVFAHPDTSARKPLAPDAPPAPTDDVKFAGLSAQDAAKEMTLPKGFKATLFAGEPDVVQPIAFCIDDRGRLWTVEGMTYPKRQPEGEGKDRIIVFEDTNGDGKFDRRTVFMEKLNLVSGIEVGFGGVWIGAAPYLSFVPVTDWDNPKPAGEAKILLDGWDYKRDTHETLNTFTWGPDGWLYGCHGVFCPSLVGKPGTPQKERQWVDAAVWRYHPTKHQFEIFAEGTSNPWGIDFDERGQCFIEACVVPHFWHVIQGARYLRQGGEHYTINAEETARNERHREAKSGKPIFPYTYADIQAHGDHVHYAGTKGPHAANGRSDAAGGGHAHAGLLVYQGDSFPAEYRGKIFMNNIHGQRLNMDVPVRNGSGFVGKHGADFANFNDKWSQVINLLTGPDGSMFMIDWYDKNQCHHNTESGHDRSNGRIFKISYGETKAAKLDLQKLSDSELVKQLASRNSWHARHAQRILHERSLEMVNVIMSAARNPAVESSAEFKAAVARLDTLGGQLLKILNSSAPAPERLRALWTLHTTTARQNDWRLAVLADKDEFVRAWGIQLLFEAAPMVQPDFLLSSKAQRPTGSWSKGWDGKTLAQMAGEGSTPFVRMSIASALQRVKPDARAETLEALLAHAEDADDHNLPLMYWYATEAVAAQGAAKALPLLAKCKIPKVREFITRRMAAASQQAATK